MSEPRIEGEGRDEREAVFYRLWKNDDIFYERYRLKRLRLKARRKKLKQAYGKPGRMEEKNEFAK